MLHPARFVALLVLASCLGPTAPPGGDGVDAIGEAEFRVLFVGNSLTYTHDIPAVVRALARADGRTLEFAALVAPDASLEDHWNRGAADVIRDLEPGIVVMQQGPSSLPANQLHLRAWAGQMAGPVREVGGVPALYMVWPSRARLHAFDAVFDAYAGAAEAVDGIFVPAGEAWREAWERDPDLPLYGPDGFHPGELGALLAALTIWATLAWDGSSPPPCPVHGVSDVPPETGALLCEAARTAVVEHARR